MFPIHGILILMEPNAPAFWLFCARLTRNFRPGGELTYWVGAVVSGSVSTKFLPLEDAAKRAGKEEFSQNVKRAMIPRLIKKGILRGKKEKKRDLVAMTMRWRECCNLEWRRSFTISRATVLWRSGLRSSRCGQTEVPAWSF